MSIFYLTLVRLIALSRQEVKRRKRETENVRLGDKWLEWIYH